MASRSRLGLRFFERVFGNGGFTGVWVVVERHPAWSLTWLWALYWGPSRRFSLSWHRGAYGSLTVGVPLAGRLTLMWQEAMPRG